MLNKIIKELVCMVIIISIAIFGSQMLNKCRKLYHYRGILDSISMSKNNRWQFNFAPKNKYKIIKNEFNSYDILLLNGQLCRGYYPTISSAQKQIDFLINQRSAWGE